MKKGIGFQVMTEILLVDDGTGAESMVTEESAREGMSKVFLEIIKEKLPAFAEAQGLRVEDMQFGCTIFFLDPDAISPQEDEETAEE